MPSCIVNHGGYKYLYYIGWNRGVTVPYRNSVGLAISDDSGLTFERVFEGPVVDRTREEPYFCASPFVMVDGGVWKLWYASSTGWAVVNGHPEPLYKIKYAESEDGVEWVRENITCIEYGFEGEANARPCVVKEDGRYRMWYCFRGSDGYRTDKNQGYRLGYAESEDGIRWTRKDEEVGIGRSEDGWDSVMMEYPYVYEHAGRKHMLYNGNGFGGSGFGYGGFGGRLEWNYEILPEKVGDLRRPSGFLERSCTWDGRILGDRDRLMGRIGEILDSQWFTNDGPVVREFERTNRRVCERETLYRHLQRDDRPGDRRFGRRGSRVR